MVKKAKLTNGQLKNDKSMNINIETAVQQDYKTVFEGFNEDLFLALKPPFLPLTLRQFDGSRTGDEVKITLGAGFFSQDWDALIVEQKETSEEIYFIDKGVKLPFFLKSWQHKHRIIKTENGSKIIDDIHYTSVLGKFSDILLFPIMYLQFYMRKPVYQRIFGK